MRCRKILAAFAMVASMAASDMSAYELAIRLFDRLDLTRVEREIRQSVNLPSHADQRLEAKLSATFRRSLVAAFVRDFTYQDLESLHRRIEHRDTLSDDFQEWLSRAIVEALQAANDEHINKGSGDGFEIRTDQPDDA